MSIRKTLALTIATVLVLTTVVCGIASADIPGPDPGPAPHADMYFSPGNLPLGTIVCDAAVPPPGPVPICFPATDNDAILLWIDKDPTAAWPHESTYIFIDSDGDVDRYHGWGWPLIGGSNYMYNVPFSWNRQFPVDLEDLSALADDGPEVMIYAYPLPIYPGDELSDGGETKIEIEAKTMLYWIDLEPGYRFEHSTMYVLVEQDGSTRLVDGNWWPELNGHIILWNQPSTYLWFPYTI